MKMSKVESIWKQLRQANHCDGDEKLTILRAAFTSAAQLGAE
jgi:hypothetical protein